MAPTKRGESEGPIVTRVFIVADTNEGSLEQPYDGRQYLVSRQLGQRDIALDAFSNTGQDLAEGDHAPELRLVTDGPVSGVIPILLSAARVPRRDLKVPRGIWTDPYLIPTRWDDELSDSLELRFVADYGAVDPYVREAAAVPLATDAGYCIRDITKAGGFCGFDVLVRGIHV